MVLFANFALAQQRTITGTVTSKEDGLPLPGVSVKIKGQSGGTMTRSDGKYTISAASSNVITFTSLGYLKSEATIGSSNVLNVSLESDSKSLEEVSIAAPYGSAQTKLTQTGSIGIVGSKDLEQTPFGSIDKALQGKVAGVFSTGGNGQPGSAQQIRIRGMSSVNASNEPLYVIDGVPINSGDLARLQTTTNALAGINPNDIESMTVLKDASAASIYGSRAANGVILITTKSGKAGATKIRFDADYGVAKPGYLPAANKPLNAAQYRELTTEGYVNAGLYPTLAAAQANYDTNIVTPARQGNNTDWLDVITQTGNQQSYNLNVSGGTEKTVFSLSGGYFKQEGSVVGSQYKRVTSNINIRHNYNEKLSFGINLNLSNGDQSGPYAGGSFRNPVLQAYFLRPFMNPYAADGVSPNLSLVDFPAGSVYNPVMNNALDINKYNALKGIGSADLAYKILPNLKFTSKIGIDYNNLEEDMYWNPDYGDGRTVGGYSFRNYTRYYNWVATNLLSYHADVLKDNSLIFNIRGGYEAQKSQQYTSSVATTGLPTSYDINVPSAGSTLNTANGTNSDYAFASILSIADISYKGRYVLQGSFRRDGSSRFGSTHHYGNFWSIGGTWNIDQEDFMKQYSFINQFKIRSSYGKNGNAGIGNYDWRPLYGYAYNYNGASGAAPSTVGNINLTWEDNKPFDIGLDLGFFKNRLSINADYYSRKSSNLLLNQPIPPSVGFVSYSNNVGTLRNRGVELMVSGTPVIAGDFRWDASFNIALNKNKMLTVADGQTQYVVGSAIYIPGSPAASWYMRQWAGVDPANGNPLWYVDETKTTTTSSYGAAKIVNTGKQSDPKGFGSFTNTFSYKGFSLDAMLYFSYGNYIRDAWASYTQSDGANGNFNRVAIQLDRWQNPGDITNVPKYVFNNANSSSSNSTRFLYKGDYVRLRDVTLGYQIPKTVLTALKVSSIKVYARASNLYTWVRDKNLPYDPETFASSATNFTVYTPKTVTFGVNIGL